MNRALLSHYARALFELAKERNEEEKYLSSLGLFQDTLKANPDFDRFLASREISTAKKDPLIDEVFAKHVEKAVLGFFHLLVKKHLSQYSQEIYEAYRHCYDLDQGIIEGRLLAPFRISDEQKAKLEAIFSRETGKKVVLKCLIDKRVIGGMKVYLADKLIDYSLDSKIEAVKDRLTYKDA